MPENATELTTYEEIRNFFTWCNTEEFRSPAYDEFNKMGGFFNLRIYWAREDMGVGYGIADDWKSKSIKWYRFGSEENWDKFRRGMSALFSGDNS